MTRSTSTSKRDIETQILQKSTRASEGTKDNGKHFPVNIAKLSQANNNEII